MILKGYTFSHQLPTPPRIPGSTQAWAGGGRKCYEILSFFGYALQYPPPDLPHLFFRKEAKFDTQERLAANFDYV